VVCKARLVFPRRKTCSDACHKELGRAKRREWRAANLERYNELQRAKRRRRKALGHVFRKRALSSADRERMRLYHLANRDAQLARSREYYRAHQGARRAASAARRERIRTIETLVAMLEEAGRRVPAPRDKRKAKPARPRRP
jgi:uncharacterized protein (DUF2461 family)